MVDSATGAAAWSWTVDAGRRTTRGHSGRATGPLGGAAAQAAARTVLERCDALAAHSEEPDRLTRRFATAALAAAGDAVMGWMRAAGLRTRRDAIGNVIGR